VQRLREELAELKTSGLSSLLVEQNVRLALAMADHVHIMQRGRIVYKGRPVELQAERAIMQKYLGVGL
jgi:branched-chain amino acid transport system ATP-binding protein